ncbi:MAG: hypothetical protein WC861_01150 [Candidatus Micrarchaeia archaeon]|jgi:hypothetical protein
MKYKGQLMFRGQELIMLFVFGGILLGAGALAMAGMTPTPTGGYQSNATASIFGNGSNALVQFSQQLPTIGIIGGISLLILMLFVGFGAFIGGRK